LHYRDRAKRGYATAKHHFARRYRRARRRIKNWLQAKCAEKKKQNLTDRAAKSTARATWAIAALTLVTIGVGISQYVIFSRQLDEMRSTGGQTDRLIEANRNLAAAAIRQADTAEVSQRAWLAPTQFSFIDLNYAADPLRVRMLYQNVGREPAKNVRNWLVSGYIRDPKPPEASKWTANPIWRTNTAFDSHDLCSKVRSETQSVIYPTPAFGQSVDISGGSGWDSPTASVEVLFEEIRNQLSIYVVMGCLSYETLGRRRNSSFCAFLMPIPGKEIAQWQFSACPIGNDDF